jgi:double-strand break repair protein MRE11
VLQPGSSVATALSEGEAKRKHVFLLEIALQQFRVSEFPLRRVRPFLHESLCLRDQPELDPEDAEVGGPSAAFAC